MWMFSCQVIYVELHDFAIRLNSGVIWRGFPAEIALDFFALDRMDEFGRVSLARRGIFFSVRDRRCDELSEGDSDLMEVCLAQKSEEELLQRLSEWRSNWFFSSCVAHLSSCVFYRFISVWSCRSSRYVQKKTGEIRMDSLSKITRQLVKLVIDEDVLLLQISNNGF